MGLDFFKMLTSCWLDIKIEYERQEYIKIEALIF